MYRFLIVVFVFLSVSSFAQKNKKPGNYLRREAQEPQTWFTLCGKKNGKSVKVADLEKAESIKIVADKFDGVNILGMDLVIKKKGMQPETFSLTDLNFTPELKAKFPTLLKGDKLLIYVKTRNRSTQVVNVVEEHKFTVAG